VIGGPSDAVIFTDGSPSDTGADPKIGGALFASWLTAPTGFGESVPNALVDRWMKKRSRITFIELFGAVCAIAQWGSTLTGKRVSMFIDSEAALDGLIKGYSKSEEACELIAVFWQLVDEYQITVYLDKVSTDSNIADGLSRDRQQDYVDAGWTIHRVDANDIVGPNSQFEKYRQTKN
jgi:hypothetical protein